MTAPTRASGSGPQFGSTALQHFDFDVGHRNLNHGSFGATPRVVRQRMRHYQDQSEARPDSFIRYEYPRLLDESRAAAAALLRAPTTDTVVFVPNATTGVNTVLRSLAAAWATSSDDNGDGDGDGDNDDGRRRDEILYFRTIYGACGKAIDYVVDSFSSSSGGGRRRRLAAREIGGFAYPCADADVVAAFRAALAACATSGGRARLCLFDTVSSLPGVRFPFEALTRACRRAGVLSLVDGAQGAGMVDLDLAALDPDFFVTSCHKWLHVPRGCAVLYVPRRNQGLITSSLPTSHGYVPRSGARFNPLPRSDKSEFVNNFEYVGTIDSSSYLTLRDAIQWRAEVFGGEAAIRGYMTELARKGGRETAKVLGTEVLDNAQQTMSDCALTNVALPLDAKEYSHVLDMMMRAMVRDYKTFIPLFSCDGRLWARLSAQVYLELDDFKWAGQVLLELCRKVQRGELQSKL
ncbi:pyridoxal phosphate-dependent transferase [Xylariaceae sp. FL0804]|nr:pyridoxal phosphate-dependent transferase [Xylariaceae sp. FL0804]